MIFKGILRGDHTFKHFTFDDSEIIMKNGEYYCKANYGKNPLEGEDADEDISYVPYSQVMVIGGKKPTLPSAEKPKTETPKVSTPKKEIKKVGRPKKEVITNTSVPENADKFEYYVDEFHLDDVHELQRKLNELGDDGWELCGFDSYKGIFKDVSLVSIFKRKRG